MSDTKNIHYQILKVGSEPNKRFLQKTMNGVEWTSQGYAHNFFFLKDAYKESQKHENSYVIWIDESPEPPHGKWGEVNPYAYQSL